MNNIWIFKNMSNGFLNGCRIVMASIASICLILAVSTSIRYSTFVTVPGIISDKNTEITENDVICYITVEYEHNNGVYSTNIDVNSINAYTIGETYNVSVNPRNPQEVENERFPRTMFFWTVVTATLLGVSFIKLASPESESDEMRKKWSNPLMYEKKAKRTPKNNTASDFLDGTTTVKQQDLTESADEFPPLTVIK